MHPARRTRPAALLAAFLMVAGAAAATTSITVTVGPDGVSVHAESDDVPRLPNGSRPPPPPPPPQPTFALDVRPDHQDTAPGEDVVFLVHVHSRRNATIDLRVANETRGFSGELGHSHVTLAAGQNATVRLLVRVPDHEAHGTLLVEGFARDTRERHADKASVSVLAPRANFTVAFDPASQRAAPGQTVVFDVVAKATAPREVSLHLTHIPRGWHAELAQTTLSINGSGVARTTMTVTVPSNTTMSGWIDLYAWTDHRENATARATVLLHDVSTQREGASSSSSGDGAPARPVPSPHRQARLEAWLETAFPMP